VLELILKPLRYDIPPDGLRVECGDGMLRQCFPRLAAWLADHMEHVDLMGLTPKDCPVCEVPPSKLEACTRLEPYPLRDYLTYALEYWSDDSSEAAQKTARLDLQQQGVNRPASAFLELQLDVASLHKPD